MDCKLGFFLFHFGRHYSSTLLILMSVEKCFAVYFPLKSKTVCTVKNAQWATGVSGVILAGYSLHWFFVVESRISMSSGHYFCDTTEYYRYSFNTVDSVLYSFGPFSLMSVTNFAIVFKFIRAKCKRNSSTQSTEQALAKSATRGTAMVVTVSVTFLLLTAPAAVDDALYHVIILDDHPTYHAFMNLSQYPQPQYQQCPVHYCWDQI